MVCIRKGRSGSPDPSSVAKCSPEPKCICARAYPTGPDGMPMGPPSSFATPTPLTSYPLPTTPLAPSQTHRVQKPGQKRVKAITHPESVARGLEKQEHFLFDRVHDLTSPSEFNALEIESQSSLPYSKNSLRKDVDEPLRHSHNCCQTEQRLQPKVETPINGATNTGSCCTQRPTNDANISTTTITATQAFGEQRNRETLKSPRGKGDSRSLNGSGYPSNSYSEISSFSPQTTIYSIPPGYATAGNPLNPQQLSELQRDPRFAQIVPEHAFHAFVGSSTPYTEADGNASNKHSCSCGPDCQCIACAAHPYNATTQGRVQDLLYSNPGEFRSTNGPSSRESGEIPTFSDVHILPASSDLHITMQPVPVVEDTHNLGIEHPAEPNPFSRDDGVPSFPHTTYTGLYEEASLPPVSFDDYYMYEYLVPDFNTCTAPAGSCQCGNDCACVGCLTHTGHDGVWLAPDPVTPPSISTAGAASESNTANTGELTNGPSLD